MKRTPFGILALLLALTLLAGCSSNTSKSLAEDAWETPAFAQEAVGDLALPASNGTMSTEASPEVASATPEVATNRKLVKTAWITAETEDFSSLTEGVTSRISQLGGYVENQETYYGSSYRDSGSRRSELVIRSSRSACRLHLSDCRNLQCHLLSGVCRRRHPHLCRHGEPEKSPGNPAGPAAGADGKGRKPWRIC